MSDWSDRHPGRRLQDGVAETRTHDLGAFHLGALAFAVGPILCVGLGLIARDLLVGLALEVP